MPAGRRCAAQHYRQAAAPRAGGPAWHRACVLPRAGGGRHCGSQSCRCACQAAAGQARPGRATFATADKPPPYAEATRRRLRGGHNGGVLLLGLCGRAQAAGGAAQQRADVQWSRRRGGGGLSQPQQCARQDVVDKCRTRGCMGGLGACTQCTWFFVCVASRQEGRHRDRLLASVGGVCANEESPSVHVLSLNMRAQ